MIIYKEDIIYIVIKKKKREIKSEDKRNNII